MSQVGQFTQYIGLVVLLVALVLVAPRLTVTAWAGLIRWFRSSWHRGRSWRPGTAAASPDDLPVEVRVGDRRATQPDEVIDAETPLKPWHVVTELWSMARDAVQGGALSLAVVGLVLRSTSALVQQAPEPVVLGSDLLLVLGTFLVMQRVIREYPAHLLPSVLSPYLRPSGQRMAARPERVVRGKLRHSLEIVVLAPGFLALIGWPAEIARFVADKQFTGPASSVIVVWACELPWLLGLTWFLARPLLPRKAPARHARVAAPVVALRLTGLAAEERQAA